MPAEFWDRPDLRTALATRDIGAVIRAYRRHPHHGRPFRQEAVAAWIGVSSTRLSRIENGEPVNNLAKLTRWAHTLRIPRHLLWFHMPDALRDDVAKATPVADSQESASGALLLNTACVPAVDSGDAERLRTRLDSLLSETASSARLEMVEQQVRDHLTQYTRTGPAEALALLIPDLAEVHALAARRHPIAVHRTLSTAVTMLTLLVADAHMKRGLIVDARRWYRTALLAARDGDDPLLAALVLAQQTMLAYYYETPERTISLARRARDLAADAVCDAAALAAAAEARALGKFGDTRGVHQALADARRLTDRLAELRTSDDPHAAYHFNHGRLALYASGALSNLGDVTHAHEAQTQALHTYAADPRLVIDPALIRLDRAFVHATSGDPAGGADLAVTTLTDLTPAHRTAVVLTRARDIVAVAEALPRVHRNAVQAVEQLRELTAV
ncbi:helix-turn-helix domain-containing protein [Saccharothrix sp. Mg75]|uniref:helix-turn-helix domain-containing protein n=1 Tax=Saccharothrix sp. Mg75 TaxID=3445357 RepID=UPI003EF013B7